MRPGSNRWPAPGAGDGVARSAPWASPEDIGRLGEAEAHPTSMFDLLPPDQDEPAFDALAAYAHVLARGRAIRSGVGPTITLARMVPDTTLTNESDDRRSAGAVGTLVYVLRWEAVSWAPAGPPAGAHRQPPNRHAIGTCTVVLDARTGVIVREQLSGSTGPATSGQ